MKIRRFNEQDTYTPLTSFKLSKEDKIYYKLHVDNSIRKFEIALDKLGIKKMVYRFFEFDLDKYRNKIEDNSVIYILIDFFGDNYNLDLIVNDPKNDNDIKFGGEVFVTDNEIDAKKYNI
jgi:hypothetical protein